jgi:hypothetical protein
LLIERKKMSSDLDKSTGLDRQGNPDPTAFDRQGNWYDPYLAWYDFYKVNPKEEVVAPKVETGFEVDGVKWGIWFPDGLPPVERNK